MASAAAILLKFFSPTTTLIYPLLPLHPKPLSLSSKLITKPQPLSLCLCTATPTNHQNPVLLQQHLDLTDHQLHLLLRAHPQLHSTPPPLLLTRISSLLSLPLPPNSLPQIILRRPETLTSPQLTPFLRFLSHSLPHLHPSKLHRLLTSTSPLLYPSLPLKADLLLRHGVPSHHLSAIANTVNISKVFCEMPFSDFEAIVAYLHSKFPWPDVLIRRPALLNLDLRTQLIPRVDYLSSLANGDHASVSVLIHKLPAVLSYTVDHYRSHTDFWLSVGLSRERLFRILLVYPSVFSVSKERKLAPRIEFLTQCGLDVDDIFKFLIKAPLFLSLSFEDNLSKKLVLLVKVGYRHRTRELALAMGAATRTSCANMQRVVGLFLEYGFSCEDLLAMSKKHPQVLQYSCRSLEKKIEFLVDGMERDVGELMAFPAFLGYKLDDRIKRRYEVKKEISGKGMSLNKLLSVSTEKFDLKTNKLLDLECDRDLETVEEG